MIEWLKNYWYDLASGYTDNDTSTKFWNEIKNHYTLKNRHYHNFTHLHNMFLQLDDLKSEIEDLDNLKFAIWYHDIIYKSTKKDNEEKSAIFAQKRLLTLGFDEKRLKNVQKLIISTKNHQIILNENKDNAYLLDLDLSILGTNWDTYKKYIQNIRKEYKIYPDFMYKPGRKKVLKHFLERETLYFTKTYKTKLEKQARENLQKEIKLL